MEDVCDYVSVKTCEMPNTKSVPKCKLWTLEDSDVSMQVHQL